MSIDSMNIEANRLASYRAWPSTAPVQPTALAKAGFYYTGKDDEVKCFSCKGRVLCWNPGDVPMEEHRKHFPSCIFLTDPRQSGNVPLDSGSVYSDGQTRLDCADVPDTITSDIGRMNIQRHHPNIPTPGLPRGIAAGKQAVQGNALAGLPNVFYSNVPTPFNREEMRFEQKRLDTLDAWPKKDLIDAKLVAETGLFYVGPGDKLKCAFCNGAMMNWDTGDNPYDEHFRYFGDRCPLAKGENTDNVPINSESAQRRTTEPRTTFDLLNIVTERPKYPDYAVLAVRETTFRNWANEEVQPSRRLAEAGFYYTGTGDQVRCFFCGGGLKNWDSTDDPWVEHAKWFDKCGFIRQMRGGDFIHQVHRSQALVKPDQNKKDEGGFDMRRVTAAMALETTQMVIQMGFSVSLVKSVIEQRLRNSGENYKTARELLEAVLVHQDAGPPTVPSHAAPSVKGGHTAMIPKETPMHAGPSTVFSDAAPTLTEHTAVVPKETPMEQKQTLQVLEKQQPAAAASNTVASEEDTEEEAMEQEPGGKSRLVLMSKSAKRRKRRKKKKLEKQAAAVASRAAGAAGAAVAASNEVALLPNSDIMPEMKEKLVKENELLKDQKLCKICMDKDCSVVFLPCGHLCSCESCAERLKNCPICKAGIRGTVKAYLA